MSWLRIDDGFTAHPKFAGWKPFQKWAFLEAMNYCSRYRTAGVIPDDHSLLPRAVTPHLLALAERSGWIDRDQLNRMVIHDWALYNPKDPTAASRKQAQRERDQNRDQTVTRVLARAVPVPSRPLKEPKAVDFALDVNDELEQTAREKLIDQLTPDLGDIE